MWFVLISFGGEMWTLYHPLCTMWKYVWVPIKIYTVGILQVFKYCSV